MVFCYNISYIKSKKYPKKEPYKKMHAHKNIDWKPLQILQLQSPLLYIWYIYVVFFL